LSYQPEAENSLAGDKKISNYNHFSADEMCTWYRSIDYGCLQPRPGRRFSLAARATSQLSLGFQHQLVACEGNICLSLYSIANTPAMTFAGADGNTHAEMARMLHFPSE
jgi:hypothetical protein